MTRRRALLAGTTFLAPLLVVAGACTFPDVTFAVGAEADGGSSADGTAETSSFDGNSTQDVVINEATTRDDATAIVDASVCETRTRCDCDNDEYADKACDVDASSILSYKGNPLKPGDCDDLDPLRFPNAPLRELPPVGHEGDWNCNGVLEASPSRNLACGGNGTLGCTGGSGYLGAPPCGTTADFYSCEPQANILATCKPKPTGAKPVQACQ